MVVKNVIRPVSLVQLAGIILAIAFVIFTTPAIRADEITLPGTPAGSRLADFLEVFNTGDSAAYFDFIEKNHVKSDDPRRSTEARVGIYNMLYRDLGGMRVIEIRESEDLTLRVLMQAVNPTDEFEWLEFTMVIDEENPDKISTFRVEPAPPPLELPDRPLTDDEIIAETKIFINERDMEGLFSGTVLIARGTDIIYQDVRGEACKRYDVPMKFDTKINIGSMNKMFTAVAIGQLVEQGRMSFDDRLIDLLPDFPMQEAAQKITVHHLLTHTSGIGDYWTEEWEKNWYRVRTLDDYLPFVVKDSLEFEPGSRFSYSNSGFIVLGMIVEAVSGMDYFDYVREHIYKPAEMTNTDCYHIEDPVPNLAIGYTRMGPDGQRLDHRINNLYLHSPQGGPAGGGFSTAEDLLRFAQALADAQIISEDMRNILWEGKVEMMGPDMMYAYGFGDHRDLPYRYVGHSGGAPGINAFMGYFPELDITVAVLCNYDRAAMPVADHVMRLVTHKG